LKQSGPDGNKTAGGNTRGALSSASSLQTRTARKEVIRSKHQERNRAGEQAARLTGTGTMRAPDTPTAGMVSGAGAAAAMTGTDATGCTSGGGGCDTVWRGTTLHGSACTNNN